MNTEICGPHATCTPTVDGMDVLYKGYNAYMSEGFKRLLTTGEMSDITLAVEGKQFCAHKLILSVFSDYFREIFRSYDSNEPIFFLKGVKFRIMDAILVFIYQGNVQIPTCDIELFLETAKDLKIKGLYDLPPGGHVGTADGGSEDDDALLNPESIVDLTTLPLDTSSPLHFLNPNVQHINLTPQEVNAILQMSQEPSTSVGLEEEKFSSAMYDNGFETESEDESDSTDDMQSESIMQGIDVSHLEDSEDEHFAIPVMPNSLPELLQAPDINAPMLNAPEFGVYEDGGFVRATVKRTAIGDYMIVNNQAYKSNVKDTYLTTWICSKYMFGCRGGLVVSSDGRIAVDNPHNHDMPHMPNDDLDDIGLGVFEEGDYLYRPTTMDAINKWLDDGGRRD